MADFQEALTRVAEYSKNNSVIVDLVIKLTHYEMPDESGKIKKSMNPFFKTVLQEAGFKWLTIDNLRSGERCTVYKHIGQKQQGDKISKEDTENSLVRLSTGKIKVSKVGFHQLLMLSDADPDVKGFKKGKLMVLLAERVASGIFDTTLGELLAIKRFKNLAAKDALKNYLKGKMKVALEKEVPEEILVSIFFANLNA